MVPQQIVTDTSISLVRRFIVNPLHQLCNTPVLIPPALVFPERHALDTLNDLQAASTGYHFHADLIRRSAGQSAVIQWQRFFEVIKNIKDEFRVRTMADLKNPAVHIGRLC